MREANTSFLVQLFSYLIDIASLLVIYIYVPTNIENPIVFLAYIFAGWTLLSWRNKFYVLNAYSKPNVVFSLLFRQNLVWLLILYAYIGIFKQPSTSRLGIFEFYLTSLAVISIIKVAYFFFVIRPYGEYVGSLKRTILIGSKRKTKPLHKILSTRKDFGYQVINRIEINQGFDLKSVFDYIIKNKIQEVFCSTSDLSNKQLEELIYFGDNNFKIIKFVPDDKKIYAKNLKLEYYDYLPVLSLRNLPLNESLNYLIKRVFDIIFSLSVIVLVLSWLTPLIAILIKLESKGPVFFKQLRSGINNDSFVCYKFRSMTSNRDKNTVQATKNDTRVTKIGKFIRRTSIDELPQFFNVLIGDMSIVGPRPHMLSHTESYAKRVNKYMVRHFVKPGITGLAQVKGYRGEILEDSDIINRVKYDIFYTENWSFFLDVKIIIQTVINVFKGEDKAY